MSGVDQYVGLVVGGPDAGQFRAVRGPSFRVVTKEEPDVVLRHEGGFEATRGILAASIEYVHTTMRFETDGGEATEFGFWVPGSERHPNRYVIETLTTAYRNGGAK